MRSFGWTRMMSLALAALFVTTMVSIARAEDAPANVAVTPAPVNAQWWTDRHEQKLKEKEAMKQVDLVMIGDSITHGWEGGGKAVWDEYYGKRNALNLGYGGDRTEHVLWRIENGEVDGISPKLVTIMIGTNNVGHGSSDPTQTVEGIKKIIAELQEKLPEAKILLLAVFPRGATPEDGLRKKTVEINQGLPALCDGEKVTFLDINDVFLDDDGTLPKSIMPDLLHPNAEGYKLWADAVEPSIAKLMGEKEEK